MQCSQCGHEVQGRALFCPHCGIKLEQSLATTRLEESASVPSSLQAPREEKQGCGMTIVVVLIAVLVIAIIAGLGIAAVYFGLADRAQTEEMAAEQHYQKGTAYLESQEYELASAEYELALQLDPEHEGARKGLDQAQTALDVQPTATPMLQREVKDAYFEALVAAYERRDWQATFEQADRLLALDVTHERAAVDQMLFDAFYQSGQELVQADRVREAVRLYDRALDLQPDNTQVQLAKRSANLYLTAMGYWGADWSKTTENLSTLYGLDPEFRDVKERLHGAHVRYAEQLGEQGEWCQAVDEYTAALAIRADTVITVARQQAQTNCQSSPQTLDPEANGPNQPPAPLVPDVDSGSFYGVLRERSGVGGKKIFIRGQVKDVQGAPLKSAQVKIQAWDWSAVAVTDATGQYAFDGLTNPVTYTLVILDMNCVPFDVVGELGQITWVDFFQAK